MLTIFSYLLFGMHCKTHIRDLCRLHDVSVTTDLPRRAYMLTPVVAYTIHKSNKTANCMLFEEPRPSAIDPARPASRPSLRQLLLAWLIANGTDSSSRIAYTWHDVML